MCTPKAYIRHNQEETLVMEDINTITWETSTRFVLRDITGKSLRMEGKILSMDLLEHRILLEGHVSD
jgi:predicted RNA-binding protein